jgi:hypothetical protein
VGHGEAGVRAADVAEKGGMGEDQHMAPGKWFGISSAKLDEESFIIDQRPPAQVNQGHDFQSRPSQSLADGLKRGAHKTNRQTS